MNISGLTVPVSTSITNSDIGIAVLRKNLDTLNQTGEDMIKMMELSVNPTLGRNIDIKV